MATDEEGFARMSKKFRISDFNRHQKDAIIQFVHEKKDIFVNLPTGYGKSLIFQALPFFFDFLFGEGHIVAVVSPLINLITDQVKFLQALDIKATSISNIESEEERREVEKGAFSIIYGTPEAWLLNQGWRDMLSNEIYSSKLCALAIDEAHVIKHWGTSTTNKLAVFRDCYSRLHELRTLAPAVHMIALTATATKDTRQAIFDVLMMHNPYVIYENPNKNNIAYSVKYMPNMDDLDHYFGWLGEELREKREHCDRTIIYCQTIRQCGLLYATLKGMLGEDIHVDGDPKHVLLEMLHSCTPLANKENIVKSFAEEDGVIRVLVATIAFGMGINCKAVRRVIHFGPSKNIESYTQEAGRAGRDGTQAIAYVLYNGMLLNHVQPDIKHYVTSQQCRRKAILQHFEDDSVPPLELHLCCDYCASVCHCESVDCGKFTSYPAKSTTEEPRCNLRTREVTEHQKKLVNQELIKYHKKLLSTLISTTSKTELKTLTGIPLLLGFSAVQIKQVLDNLQHLFTLSDIKEFVEIWDKKHAHKILCILNDVFKDMQEFSYTEINDFEMDDLLLEDWEDIVEDSELFDMALDNLSFSQLEESFAEQEANNSNTSLDAGVPSAVLETLETVHDR